MADDPTTEIRALIAELGKIPQELRTALRPELKGVADVIVADARGRASWSTRIPGAITTSVRFGARDPGVTIRVRDSKAPHGRAFEGITGASDFVHPVFGHRDREVAQSTRPYLEPAALAHMNDVLTAAAETVDRVAREHGFR